MEKETVPGQLYRHYDSEGSLLWVGQSLNAIKRLQQHIGSHWFREIVRVEITHFASREEARGAERQALATENPKYNIELEPIPPEVTARRMAGILRLRRQEVH